MSSPDPISEAEEFGENMFQKGRQSAFLEVQLLIQKELNKIEENK